MSYYYATKIIIWGHVQLALAQCPPPPGRRQWPESKISFDASHAQVTGHRSQGAPVRDGLPTIGVSSVTWRSYVTLYVVVGCRQPRHGSHRFSPDCLMRPLRRLETKGFLSETSLVEICNGATTIIVDIIKILSRMPGQRYEGVSLLRNLPVRGGPPRIMRIPR